MPKPLSASLNRHVLTMARGIVYTVSDPAQAIYAFRGADSEALANIGRAFGARELPLTVSYRCAKSVVALAQGLVPYIEAHADAPEGVVLDIETPDTPRVMDAFFATLRDDDFVLCRNTAPLVQLAYALIGSGREIGRGLVGLINQMKANNLEDMLVKLEAYRGREVAKWQSKHNESRAQAVDDKVSCIEVAAERLDEDHRTIADLVASIEALFTDKPGADMLTLATVHKSKGLERNRVFIWRADLMPSQWARQEWAQQQEDNLMYVAWTRARLELVRVFGEPK